MSLSLKALNYFIFVNIFYFNRYYHLALYRKDLPIPDLDDDSLNAERQIVCRAYWERGERHSK